MSTCPKCGSTTIVGPRYIERSMKTLGQVLRYTCAVCGYSVETPTRDAVKP